MSYLFSKPSMLLCLLNFLRALWQGAPQFTNILEQLKVSENFWGQLSHTVLLITRNQGNLSEKLTGKELKNLAYRYQILASVLDILCFEIFLQKKLMHAHIIVNQISKLPMNGAQNTMDSSKLRELGSPNGLKEIIATWCKSSLLSDLINACVSWQYDSSSHMHAKVSHAYPICYFFGSKSREIVIASSFLCFYFSII